MDAFGNLQISKCYLVISTDGSILLMKKYECLKTCASKNLFNLSMRAWNSMKS